jgi:dihydropyrimidinase
VHDLLVRGGTLVTPTSSAVEDVAVDGETIAAVGPPGSLGDAKTVIDADGCLVLPGGVDPHVHYGLDFGVVKAEGPEYSPAAAYGGTTTVVDFALQQAPTSLHDAVAAKRAETEGRMAVDYAFHAIVAGPDVSFDVVEEIGDLVRAGIPTIKLFMTYGWMVDDGEMWAVMTETTANGGMVVLHAEDDAIARRLTAGYVREGKTDGAYIVETRPPLVEEAAIRRALLLAERSGCPLYVLHIAAGSAVQALGEARARGLPAYGETLTPYLSFTADQLWENPLVSNYPVPKYADDQAVLWEALGDDRLQAVGSDHFSTTRADHYAMGTTVDSMMAGHANVELRLPVLFHLGVQEGRIGLSRFVEVVSANPAKLMGLYPRKGSLAPGSDADLVVIDPNRRWTIRAEDLHMRADYSCWDGWELRGKVVTTVLRGNVLVDEGRFVGPTGGGRFLERRLDTPPDRASTFESRPASALVS